MKALVTGATGFLGSHLAGRLLRRGDDVRALVRSGSDTAYLRECGIELAVGDVTDINSLRAAVAGVDVVYHAAANVSDWGPWHDFKTVTIMGTRNILKAAAAAGVPRFLHVSTDGVYALSALKRTVTEKSLLERSFGWLDYYRRSKAAAERIARRYAREAQMGVSIVRPGLLLGERDRAVFPGIVAFLSGGSSAYLGHGYNRLPYVYAGDVADACILVATTDLCVGEIYNVVSDEKVTQRDVLGAEAEVAGLRPPQRSVPMRVAYALAAFLEAASLAGGRRKRPDLTRFGVILLALEYREDASKLKRLGWEAKVPLAEAIRRCSEWSRREQPEPARR